MFNLLRYFSIASAIVVIIVTTVLAVIHNRHETAKLIKSAEKTNSVLAQSFANILRPRFFQHIGEMAGADGEALRANPTTREIDGAIRKLAIGLPVLKVKIYNLNGLTVYSSDPSQIGELKVDNAGFIESAHNSRAASKLSFRGSFTAFSGVLANRNLVETYVPIIGENGTVDGVFELYTDVTPLVTEIRHGTVDVVAGLAIAFGVLYGILFLIVRHADRMLGEQYASLIKNATDLAERNDRLAQEIADRQRAEAALRESELRLLQTQKMDAIGQLTGGVAHDVNNLLAIIQGCIELLGDQIGAENQMLQTAQRAATRGTELTQRLLAFSRKQSLNARPFDLGALVSGMSEMLTRTLGETVEIEIAAAPDLNDALADPAQVESALLTLALNARDAMPNGGKLTIACSNAHLEAEHVADSPESAPGDYVVLAVSDEGTGMSTEVLARAFEPFFTTKDVGRGTGLGLSMVYGFARQSGGHATIYSEAGQGTTVKLYLPVAEVAAQVEEVSRGAGIPRGGGETILVIDDDPDVRALVVGLLTDLNYKVVDVSDAAEAHAALASGTTVDLVLSDVVLPGGTSGPEFANQARTAYPDLKIIFMSGYPAEAAKRNGFFGSDNVLLNKPFQRSQIATAIRRMLD